MRLNFKRFLTFVLAVILVISVSACAMPTNESALKRLVGTYQGRYIAFDGYYWGITLNVYKSGNRLYEAVFDCYADPIEIYYEPVSSNLGPASWLCSVSYDTYTSKYLVKGTDWINRPPNVNLTYWVMDDLIDCELSSDGMTLSGDVSGATERFEIYRVIDEKPKDDSFVSIREVADREGIEMYWDSESMTAILDTGLCYTVGINETRLGEDGKLYVKMPASGDEIDLIFSPSYVREDWVSYAGYFITGLGVYYTGVGIVKVGTKFATLLTPAAPEIAEISIRTQEHIMNSEHAWNAVLKNEDNWYQIKAVIDYVMQNGTVSSYGSALQKTFQVRGQVVTVTYKIVNGVIRISNAWVNTR